MLSEYEQYLEGKGVCLVGPGGQTEIMKLGAEIDSYDIVARVGHYIKLVPEQLGTRTDIICENFWCWSKPYPLALEKMPALYNHWVAEGVKWFNHVWPNNEGLDNLKRINSANIKIREQDEMERVAIRAHIDSPTKGISSVIHFLRMPIKELLIVGMTASRGFGYRKDTVENQFGMPQGTYQWDDPQVCVRNLNRWMETIRNDDHKPVQEFEYLRNHVRGKARFDEWATRIFECE